ncbi:cysteine desulfurase-like protein [Pannonibacter tanglangensis]|uniref:Cysteine desulfurase-like protein n=1 Tax=Pannonibacter tanglangensis TaxID=2750084 RepID=A0ABW9ZEV2_9HYPH|nr:cysteine desulfurase-like protein [Pannonibacter sp. XCT-34]NBN63198.1 cysteine desulfurase-like protein [Pannonibacter sp. XCT-34]
MPSSLALDVDHVRSQFPGLSRGWTFFDNAGGSQICAPALARINTFLTEKNVQIGGTYEVSLAAAAAMLEARTAAMHLVNARRPEEIVFGASTTQLLQNLAKAMQGQLQPGDEIIVTVSDHESNIGPWDRLQAAGVVVRFWPLNKDTFTLDLADLAPLMSARTKMVCVTHVSNILGHINPVREIADFVHARGALLCVDAVAYAPHRLVDVQACDADYYVFSLYKTYGPHYAMMYGRYELLEGLDTLYHYFYARDKVPAKLEPGNACYELAYSICGIVDYLSEVGRRAGASGDTRSLITAAFAAITAQEDALTDRLLAWLGARNDCRIIGKRSNADGTRIPTIAFRFDGRDSGEVCRAMDHEKIAIRHGDFHSRRLAEYLGETGEGGMVRVSMVHYNRLEEVDHLTAAFERILGAATTSTAA